MSDPGSAADPTAANEKRGFLVAGIGGSAGSIPAFPSFFSNVPPGSGIAWVVILHLSPDYESRLAEVLQGSTPLPVTQVREATKV